MYNYNNNLGQIYGNGVGNLPNYNQINGASYPAQQMQMEQQMSQNYNNINNMQQIEMRIKGRPVSSYDEAKACMIDFDGSLFVFPDIANKCIYTKQIMLDGTAELKQYKLVTGQTEQNNNFVLTEDFTKTYTNLKQRIEALEKILGGKTNE